MTIPTSEVERMFAAVEGGDAATVREMTRRWVDIVDIRRPSDNLSLILDAVYNGKWEILDIIAPIHPGLDVFESAVLGRVTRVSHLTRTNPRLLAAYSSDGYTALHLAGGFGQIDTVRLLLERGAEVNARSRNAMDERPLHLAAAHLQYTICDLLLREGAEVNAPRADGATALHLVAERGDRSLAELLVRRNAHRAARDSHGRSAADVAEAAGHRGLTDLLRPS